MRVVICYEQAAPAELARDALTVGKALAEKGHTVAFIAGDPIALVDNAGSWIPNDLHQAPIVHPVPHLVMKRPPVDGFADLMATLGFDYKPTLMTLAGIWNRLFESLEPDVIVGLYAPIAWMVGPAHAQTFAIGNGFALPPALGTSFPRLAADSVPVADEEIMLSNANAVLSKLGQPSLSALSEILERCTSILYGVPAFDPYLQVRRSLSTGLLGELASPANPPVKNHLAAVLDVHCPGIETIILAVAGFEKIPVDIWVAGATTAMRRFLEEQPHIRFWNDYADLLEHASEATAVVHHGVQDVAQRCISIGRPQLLIPWTREQEIFSEVMRWMSCSWVKHPNVPIEEMAGTFRALLRDPSLVVGAQHHARQLANAGLPDALPHMIEQIEAAGRSGS